jgi:hypothetical protein
MALSKIITDSLTAGGINQSVLDSTSQYYTFKNRLINGNFDFWQRGTGRTIMSNGTPYLADRWAGCVGYQNGSHQRVAISSPPTGLNSQYAMRVSSNTTAEAAGGTRLDCGQKIESMNCMDLVGQTITVSFWLKCSAATWTSVTNTTESAFGAFGCRIQANTATTDSAVATDTGDYATTVSAVTGTGAVNGTTQLTIPNGSLPTTWTKYSFTSTVAASTKNLTVRFASSNLGSTAVADTVYYDIAEVQLERGSTTTTFDRRLSATELALCQRYYVKTFPQATAPAQNAGYTASCLVWSSTGSNNAYGSQVQWRFPVTMRAAPSITYYNPAASNANARNSAIAADMSISSTPIGAISSDTSMQFTAVDTTSAPGQASEVHVTANADF